LFFKDKWGVRFLIKKACKVVTIYFGERRDKYHGPTNFDETMDMFLTMIDLEKTIDAGVECDTILVNHLLEQNDHKIIEILDSLNGTQLKNGTLITMNRPWDNGEGLGFKSRDYAWKRYQDDYDYWFFIEDDCNFLKDNYLKKCIEVLEKYSNVAFVSTARGIGKYPIPHPHGGIGCTHRNFLKEVVKKHGKLPYADSTQYVDHEIQGEVEWGNVFLNMGYRLHRLDVSAAKCWWKDIQRKELKEFYYDQVFYDTEKEVYVWVVI
jgi:hypothetical protein